MAVSGRHGSCLFAGIRHRFVPIFPADFPQTSKLSIFSELLASGSLFAAFSSTRRFPKTPAYAYRFLNLHAPIQKLFKFICLGHREGISRDFAAFFKGG